MIISRKWQLAGYDSSGRILVIRRGFTLTELMMVLCVLVVLTSLATPGMLRWQRRLPLEKTVTMLQHLLVETRLEAIREGEPWCLVLPSGNSPGWQTPLDQPALTSATRTFQWPDGIVVTDITDSLGERKEPFSQRTSPYPVTFNPDVTSFDRRFRLKTVYGDQVTLHLDRLTGMAARAVSTTQHRPAGERGTFSFRDEQENKELHRAEPVLR